ncbi:hypothetical protein TGVAND_435400 [Toxoplasma gondii VAND]|uniref:Uncharacterized protein n=1 Tax=Toxoplasma gondii VAND TaxID=933077 RepID=A0A086QLM6_TOXGO|nr:hypothetical protein TGVAND_435400 [Toxoplasma gondii VAND]
MSPDSGGRLVSIAIGCAEEKKTGVCRKHRQESGRRSDPGEASKGDRRFPAERRTSSDRCPGRPQHRGAPNRRDPDRPHTKDYEGVNAQLFSTETHLHEGILCETRVPGCGKEQVHRAPGRAPRARRPSSVPQTLRRMQLTGLAGRR